MASQYSYDTSLSDLRSTMRPSELAATLQDIDWPYPRPGVHITDSLSG
jgi:hypothetical protein